MQDSNGVHLVPLPPVSNLCTIQTETGTFVGGDDHCSGYAE
jgi:hypothetical protein